MISNDITSEIIILIDILSRFALSQCSQNSFVPNVENGQLYFKDIALSTPQNFETTLSHFSILCMKWLRFV